MKTVGFVAKTLLCIAPIFIALIGINIMKMIPLPIVLVGGFLLIAWLLCNEFNVFELKGNKNLTKHIDNIL